MVMLIIKRYILITNKKSEAIKASFVESLWTLSLETSRQLQSLRPNKRQMRLETLYKETNYITNNCYISKVAL